MLEIKKISVSYGKNSVLENLSAQFSASSIHGILGVNGAGKSTFFNSLYGTKKVDEGEVLLDQVPLEKRDIAFLQTENYFYPLISIIKSLKEKGKYVLISSHILSSLLIMSDNIFRLRNRRFDAPIAREGFAQFEIDFRKEISGEISDKLKKLKF